MKVIYSLLCLVMCNFANFEQINAIEQPKITMKMEPTGQSPALVGKWIVIGCQLNGVWLPHPIFENFIYSFPDLGHYTLSWADLTFPKYVGGFPKSDNGTISINTQVIPNTIDLVPAAGPYAGKTMMGIFELDHDVLKANFAFPGNERPKVFSAGQGQVYEIWQRIQ